MKHLKTNCDLTTKAFRIISVKRRQNELKTTSSFIPRKLLSLNMCQQLWEAPSPGLVFIWQAHSCTHSIAQGNLSKMISGLFF